MVKLSLRLLGEFSAAGHDGHPIVISAKKNHALLAVLALASSGRLSRHNLTDLLWGDRADEQARKSLRQALVSLRRELNCAEPAALVITGENVGLDLERIDVDALAFARLVATESLTDLRAAVSLYRGPLLSGLTLRAPDFEEWLRYQRERFHDLAARPTQ
jgi:DNA-binding SARP family transcriptional activator